MTPSRSRTLKSRRPGAVLALLGALCVGAPAVGTLAVPGMAAPADEQIRPFDTVYLKVSPNEPIVGTIEGPWDPAVTAEITIRTKKGATSRIRAEQVDRVVPRQTADEVYSKKLAAARGERDAERRARSLLALGVWCRTPLAVLDGKPPCPANALEHTFEAVELVPGLAEAYPYLVSILDGQGPLEEAEPEQVANEVKAVMLARYGQIQDPELDFRLGVLLATRMGLESKAQPILEKFLASGTRNRGELRRARAVLRDIYLKQGLPEKAVVMYQAAIAKPENRSENFEPLFELARLEARRGHPPDRSAAEWDQYVRSLFDKAAAVQPDYQEIQAELASLDYRKGDLASAAKRLKDLLAADPRGARAHTDLALVLRRLGKREAAEKELNTALPLVEGLEKARLHLARGALHEDKDDVRGAVEEYRKAIQADPASMELKVLLAFALVRLGEPAEARQLADEILSTGGGNPAVFAALSRIRAEADLAAGKPETALENFDRAIEVDRTDGSLMERAGIVRMRLGMLDAAYGLLRRAMQVGGDHPAALNAMAYYHYQRGEFDKARQLFDEVLRRVPAPPRPATGAPPPVPPARAYALQGRELIDDLDRLEVWAADFKGEDAESLAGWEETELYGISISRKESMIVLAGKQMGTDDGVTSAMLDRQVDWPTFERVSVRMRIDSGRVRPALRLEDYAPKGNITPGLVFFRDLDGVLRIHARTSQGTAELIQPTEALPPQGGRLVYLGKTTWPEDRAFHTLEIRRASAARASASRTLVSFDLYFDGEPLAWNVKVGGLGGKSVKVGFSGQTDAVGNEYSITVENLKIYRERPRRPASSQRW